ncbi:MAG: AI-2E family transporter [Bacilli bacterium]|nr:AI-2E family transporter [Bacilli bacterium]
MIKNKLDYKLVNIAIIIFIGYLIYQAKDFWISVVSALYQCLLPFLVAFVLAYALNSVVNIMCKHKIPRFMAVMILILFILVVFGFLSYMIIPSFLQQATSLFDAVIAFVKEFSMRFNLDVSDVLDKLTVIFNDFLNKSGSYISDGALNIIGLSASFFSKLLIVLTGVIYFLYDMDKIREKIKKFLIFKNKKIYFYLSSIDKQLYKYFSGFLKIVVISFFEYVLIYSIIGHPDALMLGLLASLMNFIPYFGGIITNVVAFVTAFTVSLGLVIKTVIVFIVFSVVDGYLINPLVYGKSNQIHPLILIFSVFVCGSLFGIFGIIFSLPLTIVIISTYKYFKKDIKYLHYKLK